MKSPPPQKKKKKKNSYLKLIILLSISLIYNWLLVAMVSNYVKLYLSLIDYYKIS